MIRHASSQPVQSPRRARCSPPGRPTPPIVSVLAVVAVLLSAFAAVGPAGATDRSYAESTEVTAVEVPVQVVHRGEPVRGLDATAFRLFDEGEAREITSFDVVDLATRRTVGPPAAADPAPGGDRTPPPAAARRHLLLFFDLAFSTPADVIRAERAARELVASGLAPTDLVGVALYAPRRGASMVLRFTSDHGQVLAVLDALRALLDGDPPQTPDAAGSPGGRVDPLRLTAGITQTSLADLGASQGVQTLLMEDALAWAGPFDGWGGKYELNKMMNFIWHLDQGLRDRRAGDIADLSESLASLAEQTAGIAGPKHLVLFSRGFDVRLLQTRTRTEKILIPGAEASWFAVGGGSWILDEVNSMIATMRRSGWSIHAVEMAGTRGWNWNFREGLFFVAEETGGALYENTNDPLLALEEVVERTAVTYLLTFQVGELPAEPLMRRLRVEVDGLPRGARVVHRAAYERPRPWTDLPAARRRAESAEAILADADRDNLGLRTLALPRMAGGGAWSVPVALEVDGLSLLAGDLDRVPGAEIYAYAFDAGGGVVDLVAHRVTFREAEARGRLAERGLKFLGDLALPAPGDYRLRILVRSLRNGETALQTVPLHLPTPSANGRRTVLLPPVLLEPETSGEGGWIVTTEIDRPSDPTVEGSDGSPTPEHPPFTLHGRTLTPAVGTLRIGGPAPVDTGNLLILGYGLDRASGALLIELIGPDGQSAGTPTVLSRAPGAVPEPDLLLATLPPDLPPGTYTLRISIATDEGTVQARTTRQFQIERPPSGS